MNELFKKPKFMLALFFGLIFIVILLQNTQVVSLRLLFWEISMSRIILLPLIMGVGVVIGFILGRIRE